MIRKNYYKKKKSNSKIYISILVIIFAIWFIINNKNIDTKKPTISLNGNTLVVNKNFILNIDITDKSNIRSYEIYLSDGEQESSINPKEVKIQNGFHLNISLSNIPSYFDKNNLYLYISATDNSMWRLGNKKVKKLKVIIDNTKPQISLIDFSKSITKGGSAIVVFKVSEKHINLNNIYIKTNFNKKFYVKKFIKEGYYATIIAWPVYKKNFSAQIVAIDDAQNKSSYGLPFYTIKKIYKTSKIKFKNKTLDNISRLYPVILSRDNITPNQSLLKTERFIKLNQDTRALNETQLSKYTYDMQNPYDLNEEFDIKKFYPLKHAATVGGFGVFRIFYYKGKKISTSYHLGRDLASVRRADIVASNDGNVVFSKHNGIYGNTIIISHKFGLYTSYSHMSRMLKYQGNNIKKGETIGRTGKSGLVFGDHLHFGVFIQGLEARPAEWMDQNWINSHIINILNNAKNIIQDSQD